MNKKNDNGIHRKQIVAATAIMVFIAFVLVILGYLYLALTGDYSFDSLVKDIIGNLIGVLAAFILFDILYNKFTQDAYAKETSKCIAKTIMGDEEVLNAFSNEDKQNFIKATIKSIVSDDDAVELTDSKLKQYFQYNGNFRIRKSFNYNVTLTTEEPTIEYRDIPGWTDGKYFNVQENINYDVKTLKGINPALKTNEVKLAFTYDKRTLDRGMLSKNEEADFANCIFSENFDVDKDVIDYLKNIKESERVEKFEKTFSPAVKIDGIPAKLKKVDMKETGILLVYDVNGFASDSTNRKAEENEHSVRVIFHMPKLWDSIFEVALIDPTKSPKILFDYNPVNMDVSMYSFLNKGNESNDGAYETENGLYDITIKDEWIYPKSGIVFSVKKKKETVNE